MEKVLILPVWQYDEIRQVGTDYTDEAQVEAYDQRMQSLRDVKAFLGGLHWQAFAYALWEQILCAAIIITLLVYFREKYNDQGRLLKAMSASAYTVYILHAPVIVFLALGLRGVILDPLLKFVLVAPLAVSLCFLLSNYIRKLPIAGNIL